MCKVILQQVALFQSEGAQMRKFIAVACLALGSVLTGSGMEQARADHGFGGRGFPSGPSCYSGHHGGYGSGYGYSTGYRGIPVVPVYSSGLIRTYSVGPTSPFGYGTVGLPGYGVGYGGSGYGGLGYSGLGYGGLGYGGGYYGSGYGVGYGGVPRVQLRIGF